MPSLISGISPISTRSWPSHQNKGFQAEAYNWQCSKRLAKLEQKLSRLFNSKHIKTNINDELIIKGEKDKSSGCRDLSQPKTENHLLVVGSGAGFPAWRSVGLHVQPVIIAGSHSLAQEMWELRAIRSGEQLLGWGGSLWQGFMQWKMNKKRGKFCKTHEKHCPKGWNSWGGWLSQHLASPN